MSAYIRTLVCIASFIIALFVYRMANAAPYVYTAEFQSGLVSTCTFNLNSGASVDVTPTVKTTDTSKSFCKYDVASSVAGNNLVSVSYKNIWGYSAAVPFGYSRENPPTPSGLYLSAE